MYKKRLHPSILREYDIRGVMGESLFEKDAYWIGKCFGHVVREKAGNTVVVGRDGRFSSPQLEGSLIEGLCDAGLDVYHIGLGPTPMLYFAEYILAVDAAVMVTGSHNPPSHNGFKMSLNRKPFFGKDIAAFSELINQPLCRGKGKVRTSNILDLYLDRLLQNIQLTDTLRVVWDSGNGSAGNILEKLTSQLQGYHILLNTEINGMFPAHPPDPSNPANLQQLQQVVIKNKCDLGIAFDGDGDRLSVVDGKGRILWGDQLLLLFASDVLKRHPSATVIADIKASQGLFDEVQRLGGQPKMWKTGHSHIKARMVESGAILAGEMSGHFFFKEKYYGFDDGIYAAIRLLNILSFSSQSLSEFYDRLPCLYSTPEVRISCNSERKFKIPQFIKSRLRAQGYSFIDLDGVRVQLPEGWWLLRASHTEDALVVRCESSTREGLEIVKGHLKGELAIERIFHEMI